MNNLTQTQYDAKQSLLNDLQAQMMSHIYQNADETERAAIIRHIDSFLKVAANDARLFWLELRKSLEKLNEKNEF